MAMDVVRGKMPRGKMVATFSPKETFHSEEMGSTYVKGMNYTLREGQESLRRMLNHWVRDGKVTVAGDITGG